MRLAVKGFAFTALSPVLRITLSRGPPCYRTGITPPSLRAGTHGASHPGWGGPPRRGPVEPYAGVPGEVWEGRTAVAEYLAPRPCEGGLRYKAVPMLAEDVAGGSR